MTMIISRKKAQKAQKVSPFEGLIFLRLLRLFASVGSVLAGQFALAAQPSPKPADAERATLVVVAGAPGEAEFGQQFRDQLETWQKIGAQAGVKTVAIGADEEGTPDDRTRLEQALAAEQKDGAAELWLVLLEITVISFFWQFGYRGMILQTLWSLGWSMVALAALLYLPMWAMLSIAALMIFGHNALDGIHAQNLGAFALPWALVHEFYFDQVAPTFFIAVGYPLVPWIGVMAAGYAFGRVLDLDRERRDRIMLAIGFAAIVLFLALRVTNVYGDMKLWTANPRGTLYTALDLLNVTKYPPSLQYLLMTLGPALMLMPLLERWRGAWADRVAVYGRVPFFYYVVHLPLIHLAALIWTLTVFHATTLGDFFHNEFAPGYTPSLLRVYLVWIAVVLVLYWPCKRYAAYKRAHREKWWLSYL